MVWGELPKDDEVGRMACWEEEAPMTRWPREQEKQLMSSRISCHSWPAVLVAYCCGPPGREPAGAAWWMMNSDDSREMAGCLTG